MPDYSQFITPYYGWPGTVNAPVAAPPPPGRNNVAPPFFVDESGRLAKPPVVAPVAPPPPLGGAPGDPYRDIKIGGPGYYEQWRRWYKENPISPEAQRQIESWGIEGFGKPRTPDASDVGPGIPQPGFDENGPVGGVTSTDLPRQTPVAPQQAAFQGPRYMLPPASGRYSSGIPLSDFIYTNPAAAQQAAASLQARLGYEQNQDESYRRYRIAQEQAQQQQGYLTNRAVEAEKDRNLQREGFASSERSAQLRGGYGQSDFDLRNKAYQDELLRKDYEAKKAAYNQAVNALTILNNPKATQAQTAKLKDPRFVRQNPATGVWELGEGIVDPDVTGHPGRPPQAIPTIGEIQAARQNQPPVAATPAPTAPSKPPVGSIVPPWVW